MADWIEVGEEAPDFTLRTDDGSEVTLSTLRSSPVVLFFYPKDDTPGCTIEAEDFRDSIGDFSQVGTKIVGVSKDSIKRHDNFKAKFNLKTLKLSHD